MKDTRKLVRFRLRVECFSESQVHVLIETRETGAGFNIKFDARSSRGTHAPDQEPLLLINFLVCLGKFKSFPKLLLPKWGRGGRGERERETETERDRQTDRQTEAEREAERDRQTETDRQTDID